ncbi:MAG: H-NS histone family protein [Rhodospirillales bacterium]|nr:H-NS histone family protein [Acetobacter sp.]
MATKVNFDQMSPAELTVLIQQAGEARKAREVEAKATLLDKWRAEATENGLTIEEVLGSQAGGQKRGRKPGSGKGQSNVAVKFRGPNGEAWTGRGRTPRWMTAMEAEGRNRDEFRVQ